MTSTYYSTQTETQQLTGGGITWVTNQQPTGTFTSTWYPQPTVIIVTETVPTSKPITTAGSAASGQAPATFLYTLTFGTPAETVTISLIDTTLPSNAPATVKADPTATAANAPSPPIITGGGGGVGRRA